MISMLYILQAGLIAGPTKIKEVFIHLQKLLLLLLLLLLQNKYHAPAFTCYINEFMIVLVYTSSHLIKQQKSHQMRGSVCFLYFYGIWYFFLPSLHDHIVETSLYLYFLGISCQVSIKGSNSFCPKKDTK